MSVEKIQIAIRGKADPEKAKHSFRFFKSGKGEYAEGDQFLGIRVPELRALVKQFQQTPLADVITILKSDYHEERLFALFLLVHQFSKADSVLGKKIVKAYLDHTRFINNWDLVDSSAHHILGCYLFDKSRRQLYQLAESNSLWERRIAMIATYYFIKRDDFDDALKLAELLLADQHDLIHKVSGWMLREIGNRNKSVEDAFLQQHYRDMPRTMLRYAIEKYPESERQAYLTGAA